LNLLLDLLLFLQLEELSFFILLLLLLHTQLHPLFRLLLLNLLLPDLQFFALLVPLFQFVHELLLYDDFIYLLLLKWKRLRQKRLAFNAVCIHLWRFLLSQFYQLKFFLHLRINVQKLWVILLVIFIYRLCELDIAIILYLQFIFEFWIGCSCVWSVLYRRGEMLHKIKIII
jgi:hypothetical protein